ncbi:hypothetical protein JoomaDRAFT_1930 [Galbibacter orientalis DSM 19592]|uniref:Uncharacterized protein n=1 Tax=Galbibacter orientalis DSM 19592 TaxID=926559 RepID=I3C5N5_9FLAO|nr:hypothetical protein JoomaDRAFT_1930 [Galbibacter orientalis DSM 19592]|tara:strand:+ start:137 stop:253 length:117 start_codon:yes stop_codon:yes gene_type:complete
MLLPGQTHTFSLFRFFWASKRNEKHKVVDGWIDIRASK